MDTVLQVVAFLRVESRLGLCVYTRMLRQIQLAFLVIVAAYGFLPVSEGGMLPEELLGRAIRGDESVLPEIKRLMGAPEKASFKQPSDDRKVLCHSELIRITNLPPQVAIEDAIPQFKVKTPAFVEFLLWCLETYAGDENLNVPAAYKLYKWDIIHVSSISFLILIVSDQYDPFKPSKYSPEAGEIVERIVNEGNRTGDERWVDTLLDSYNIEIKTIEDSRGGPRITFTEHGVEFVSKQPKLAGYLPTTTPVTQLILDILRAWAIDSQSRLAAEATEALIEIGASELHARDTLKRLSETHEPPDTDSLLLARVRRKLTEWEDGTE